jgi:hypothetical protein
MPRKSIAAKMTPQLERPRLQPPTTGLSSRERAIFKDVVNSVRPEHFAAEDAPLIALLARGLSQYETAAREIETGSTDKFWIELQMSALKTVDVMTRKLRLGALSRAPHNQRKNGGTAQSGLPLPWEGYNNPSLHAVPDTGDERRFSDLRQRMGDRRAIMAPVEFGQHGGDQGADGILKASEAPDTALVSAT